MTQLLALPSEGHVLRNKLLHESHDLAVPTLPDKIGEGELITRWALVNLQIRGAGLGLDHRRRGGTLRLICLICNLLRTLVCARICLLRAPLCLTNARFCLL